MGEDLPAANALNKSRLQDYHLLLSDRFRGMGAAVEQWEESMTRVLIAAAALSALAGAALAQPAYENGQGAAPSNYPLCTHKGQDRCTQHGKGGWHGGGGGHHNHHAAAKAVHSSADGERG